MFQQCTCLDLLFNCIIVPAGSPKILKILWKIKVKEDTKIDLNN